MKIEEGSYYHVYNRGNNKGLIFFEEANYDYFLEKFKKYVCPNVDIFAYCLMPNHFHFFLRIIDPNGFEKGIKNFLISYTKSINQTYKKVGSLFQGRYKSKKIDSEEYYTRIITYIHHNPKDAGMVKNLEDYRFSSYKAYVTGKPTLIKKEEVLRWFGNLEGFIADHAL